MSASIVPGRYEWRDETPYSTPYGDVYHSAGGGPQQARQVFLAGNELPARFSTENPVSCSASRTDPATLQVASVAPGAARRESARIV